MPLEQVEFGAHKAARRCDNTPGHGHRRLGPMTSEAYTEKRCGKCERSLPLDAFHRLKSAKDGRQWRCKNCQREANTHWTRENRERSNERLRRWRAENPESIRATVKRTRAKDPEKYLAQRIVYFALKLGAIVRAEHCEQCGTAAGLHGHHHDYLKPLDVEWLCPKCHRGRHPRVLRTVV